MDRVLEFELFGSHRLRLRLYCDVSNASALKDMVLSKALPYECAMVSSSAIVDILHVHVAANNALTSKAHSALKTQSLYQELLFELGSTRQIHRSLAEFGINESSSTILLAMFDTTSDQMDEVAALIRGKQIHVDELRQRFDRDRVKEIFQLEHKEMNASHDELVCAVVGRVGAKNCFR